MIRFCKCAHNPVKHKEIVLKARECTQNRCDGFYSMVRIHRCRAEQTIRGRCLTEGCDCKSMRPESNVERKERVYEL